MRVITYIIFILLISCTNQSKQVVSETKYNAEIDNSKYYTEEDTVLILSRVDTLKFTKYDYNKTIDNNPEFFDNYPQEPSLLYICKKDLSGFGSEAGQDFYFILYQHFLKLRNGEKEYEQERKNLIEIYSTINLLYGRLEHGGTYFGHQYQRILGYAEYSVYLYKSYKNNIDESYPIKKEKELYLKSLHQLIDNKISMDPDILEKDKSSEIKELYEAANILDKLITNIFYLRRAQEFQYRHYEYYS